MSDHPTQPAAVRPGRYVWRYGAAANAPARPCPLCAVPVPSTRARYCSEACKQRAYRLRQVDRTAAGLTALATKLKRQQTLAAHTVYECPLCETRLLGERRCTDCNRFCRALGLGGPCPHCDELVVIADLLGEEVRR
jgi:hypothetical protein